MSITSTIALSMAGFTLGFYAGAYVARNYWRECTRERHRLMSQIIHLQNQLDDQRGETRE